MIPSKNCLDITKASEGCNLKAYNDPGSGGLPITCGWGSTIRADGTKFKLGDSLTQAQADNLLQFTINQVGKQVVAALGNTIVTQTQFDALVDFDYNEGNGRLLGSNLLKLVKANPSNPVIAAEFMKWKYSNHKVFNGLVNRRAAEVKLYFSI